MVLFMQPDAIWPVQCSSNLLKVQWKYVWVSLISVTVSSIQMALLSSHHFRASGEITGSILAPSVTYLEIKGHSV